MTVKHGATWWSGRFLRSLERLGMTTRLRRGHALFEQGRVHHLKLEHGGVRTQVQGNELYHCEIYFEPFSDMEWNESLERLAFEDLSAAALLTTGRMPPQIEDFFAPSGRKLLPHSGNDLEFHCSCADRAIPCKHLAASAYALAEMLDLDPWLLFLLRGRSAEEVEKSLRALWNRDFSEEDYKSKKVETSPSTPPSLETNIDLFWANHLTERILFQNNISHSSGLTLERMSTPEPKVDESAWKRSLQSIYVEVSHRAAEKLSNL